MTFLHLSTLCFLQHSSHSKAIDHYLYSWPSYLYIPHFIQSTVCESSDVCPLHPSWLIASLLLTHFKTDCTFLIHQIFFYLFIYLFFPQYGSLPASPSLKVSLCLCGSEGKMAIARREDHSNAASRWNSCALLWASGFFFTFFVCVSHI